MIYCLLHLLHSYTVTGREYAPSICSCRRAIFRMHSYLENACDETYATDSGRVISFYVCLDCTRRVISRVNSCPQHATTGFCRRTTETTFYWRRRSSSKYTSTSVRRQTTACFFTLSNTSLYWYALLDRNYLIFAASCKERNVSWSKVFPVVVISNFI